LNRRRETDGGQVAATLLVMGVGPVGLTLAGCLVDAN